ncbi:MAG: F0F1 ATP synthase subunit C [Alphaproteobacteria bacterium]|nr:MAG: F0F1 ATP synthase subunit C [Alphaproteobacteria bacterium]
MDPVSAKYLAAALALLPVFGVGLALGNLANAWLTAIARNPSAASQLRPVAFLTLGMTEALALFALAVSIILLFVV